MGPPVGQGLERVPQRDGVTAHQFKTDVIRGVHVPDGALGEEPRLGRLAEPRQEGDVDRRARCLFDTPVGRDPALVDAGARGLDVVKGQFRDQTRQGAMEGAFADRTIELAEADLPEFARHPPKAFISRHFP